MTVQIPERPTVKPREVEALDAGVIEEARARQRRQRGAVAAALLAATLAIVFAAGGVGGNLHATPGSSDPGLSAGKTARTSLVACSRKPTFTESTPDESLLSTLGVLRRPATASDAPASLKATVAADDGAFGQIFVRYIRRARVVAGVRYYVMPGRFTACGAPVPTRLRNEYMVLWVGPRGYAAGTAAMIREGGFFDQTVRLASRSTIEMVVPDDVAAVTLHYPAGPIGGYDRHHAPAITITTKVVGNLLVVTIPRGDNRVMAPMTMTWRAADRNIIKTFSNSL